MASLFDYYNKGSGRRAPTGYSFRTSNSGKDTYTPVNQLNRSNRYRRNPGSVGGGRSNLDNQRGFSNQGIGSFSNRQPGLFGSRTAMPSPGMTGRDAAASNANTPIIEEEEVSFTDEGLGKNIVNDAKTMSSDLIRNPLANAAKKFPPGLLGLFGRMSDSIGNNRQDHRYLNSIFGRASPDKTMAFFGKAEDDMRDSSFAPNVSTQSYGDTTRGSSLGQAMKYFDRAGITQQNLDRFYDPNDKFYGNEAYLASQAGGSGAEDFATGMSFIKNAKASAKLAEQEAMKQQADAAARGVSYAEPDLVNDDILYGEPGYGMSDVTSGISYTDPDLVNDDILYGEPGNMGTGSIDVGRPPSQVQPGMNFMEPFDPYEGIYESPLTDDLYSENLVQVSPNPRLMNKAQYMLPRDTAAIESMGGGMNALPLLGFEEEELIQDPRGRLRLYGN